MVKYAPGKIILFSEGRYSDYGYSDYGYCGQVVTLVECSFFELAEEYKKTFVGKSTYSKPDGDGFVSWLCANQHVAQINAEEINIGTYGHLEVPK